MTTCTCKAYIDMVHYVYTTGTEGVNVTQGLLDQGTLVSSLGERDFNQEQSISQLG